MSLFKSSDSGTKIEEYVKTLILKGETLEKVFPIGVEFLAITDKRLIIKDRDGLFSGHASVISVQLSKVAGAAFNVAISSLQAPIPTLKIFGTGFSVELKGWDQNMVVQAHHDVMYKILG